MVCVGVHDKWRIRTHDNIFTARMSLLQLQMLSEALNSLPELICIDSCT